MQGLGRASTCYREARARAGVYAVPSTDGIRVPIRKSN